MALLFCVDFILEIHIKARYQPASLGPHTLSLENQRKKESFFSPVQAASVLGWFGIHVVL